MAEFDEAAVQAWLATVPGLAAPQLAAAADRMAEDEYEGAELVGCTAKTLRRLLKGSGAEDAVPLLLAARDEQLTAENEAEHERQAEQAAADTASIVADHAAAVTAATRTANAAVAKAEEAAAKAAPSCGVCFEAYGETAVPRILACGHTFCEECLCKMLRCAIQP
jgi:hypothetical protein